MIAILALCVVPMLALAVMVAAIAIVEEA